MSTLSWLFTPKRLAVAVTVVAIFNLVVGLGTIAIAPSPAFADNMLRLREALATPALLLIVATWVRVSDQHDEQFRHYVVPNLTPRHRATGDHAEPRGSSATSIHPAA